MSRHLRLYGPPVGLALLAFIMARLVLGFNGLYGQDAFEYLRYTRALRSWLLTGADPGDYFWPVGYPLLGAVISALTGNPGLVLQLISLLSFIGLMVYCARVAKFLYADISALPAFLLVLVAAAPFLLRASLLCMSDMGAAFFIMASCYHFLKSTREKAVLHFTLACAAAAAAVMFRYVSVLLWLPVALYAGIGLLRQQKWLPVITGLLVALLVLLPHYLLRRDASGEFLGHAWLTGWSPANAWKRSFTTADGTQVHPMPNLLFVIKNLFHPGYSLLALFLLPFWKRRDLGPPYLAVGAGLLLYLVFMTGVPIQNTRFLLLSTPSWLLLLFPAFTRGWQRLKGNWKPVVLAAVLLIQAGLTLAAFRQMYLRMQLEYSIHAYLSSCCAGREIYTMDMDVSLKGYETPLVYYNLWEKRYADFHAGALVLVQEQRWEKQWKDRNPMLNWEAIQQGYDVMEVKKFGDDWTLYEIR